MNENYIVFALTMATATATTAFAVAAIISLEDEFLSYKE
jgi:hypothetical protein